MHRLVGVGLVVLGVSAFSLAQRPAAQSAASSKYEHVYLVVYKPGPAWIPNKPIGEQPLREHAAYMSSLHKQGTLRMAGPFSDNSGGALVFRAADEAAARQVVAADPAVISGVFVGELRPWTLVFYGKDAAVQD